MSIASSATYRAGGVTSAGALPRRKPSGSSSVTVAKLARSRSRRSSRLLEGGLPRLSGPRDRGRDDELFFFRLFLLDVSTITPGAGLRHDAVTISP